MTLDIGPQYKFDDPFKATARLHQSNYRARVLQGGYAEYVVRVTTVRYPPTSRLQHDIP